MPVPRNDPLQEKEQAAEAFPARGIRGVKEVEGGDVPSHPLAEHPGTPGSIGAATLGHDHTPLHRLDATGDPGSGDDSLDGYSEGSLWVNVSGGTAFVCIDATESGAVWTEITGAGSHGAGAWDAHGDVTLTSEAQGELIYHNGTAWVNLGVGTAGQHLESGGAAANPSWEDSTDVHAEIHTHDGGDTPQLEAIDTHEGSTANQHLYEVYIPFGNEPETGVTIFPA